jgi:hypothetical protein
MKCDETYLPPSDERQVMTQHAEKKRNEKVCDEKTQTPNEKKTKHTCEVMMMMSDDE